MKRLATLALFAALLPLAGCMSHQGLQRVPADQLKAIDAASKKPVVIVLTSGHAIEDATILGWTHIGMSPALVVDTEDEGHILIKGDQISLIILPKDKGAPDGNPKNDPATRPAAGPDKP